MEGREKLQEDLASALVLLQENVDKSFAYLNQYPEEKEEVAKIWYNTVKAFLDYGIKKSEANKEYNLFKRISKLLMFGR